MKAQFLARRMQPRRMIRNVVTGFGGFFWAPDVIFVSNQYRLYYSCAGQGGGDAGDYFRQALL